MNQDEARAARRAAFAESLRSTPPRKRRVGSISIGEARRIQAEALEERPSAPPPEWRDQYDPVSLASTRAREAARAVRLKALDDRGGHKGGNFKLCADDVRAIRAEYADGAPASALAPKYPVGLDQVNHIVAGRRWAWVDASSWQPVTRDRRRKVTPDLERSMRIEYAAGHSKREIARRLGVNEWTVRAYVRRVPA